MSNPQRSFVNNLSLDVRLLRYFSRAYELGSYAKASDSLYISRQALRYGIKSIEDMLGCTLFVMHGNRITPTREGEVLYRLSQKTLAAYEEMEKMLIDELIDKRHRCRNGQVAGVHELLTCDALNSRREAYIDKPHVFVTGTCQSLRRMLRENRVDNICMITDEPTDEEFDYVLTQQGKLYLMVNRNHPYAERTTVSIEDLRDQRFVSQGDEFDLHRRLVHECRLAGFELNVVYTGMDFFELANQVNANAGVSYSLFPYANHYNAEHIVYIPFDPPIQWYTLQLSRKH